MCPFQRPASPGIAGIKKYPEGFLMAYTFRPARTGRCFSLAKMFSGKTPDGHSLAFTNAYLTVDGRPFFVVAGRRITPPGPCKVAGCPPEDEGLRRQCGLHVYFLDPPRGVQRQVRFFRKAGTFGICQAVWGTGAVCDPAAGPLQPWRGAQRRRAGLGIRLPFRPRSTDPGFLRLVERLYGRIAAQAEGLAVQG